MLNFLEFAAGIKVCATRTTALLTGSRGSHCGGKWLEMCIHAFVFTCTFICAFSRIIVDKFLDSYGALLK